MKLRASVLGAALVFGALPGGAVFQSVACASPGPSAALVVDTGSGASSFCVTLPASSVSGTKLIQLAGEQHGLQYRIEGGAVCQLAGTGPSEGDCFSEHPNFWGYWRGDGSGGWTWSSSGGATTTVEAGDVEGWAWGTGNDGSSHPSPPATRYSSVCAAAAPAEPKDDEPTSGGGGGRSGSKGQPEVSGEGQENDDSTATTEGTLENDDATSEPADSKKQKQQKKNRSPKVDKKKEEAAAASPDAVAEPESDPEDLAATLPAGAEDEGPPMVGLAGLGAALLLGGLGALAVRRRQVR